MLRRLSILMLGLLLIAPALAQDAGAPSGNWQLAFMNNERMQTPWMVGFEKKDGKWTGSFVASVEGAPGGEVKDVKVKDGQLTFTFVLKTPRGDRDISFEGVLPKGKKKKILGTMGVGSSATLAELTPTKAKSFKDRTVLAKEALDEMDGPEIFAALEGLLANAEAEKTPPEQVKAWAARAVKSAADYGERWELQTTIDVATILSEQKPYAALAIDYAQKARKLLPDDSEPMLKVRILNLLADTLEKADKKDQAAKIVKEADEVYLKSMPPFKPEKVTRKKDGQPVLVELFTGAQCPPCVAADLAFDGLEKTYPVKDVVLLQYHLHIPGPDPLTNKNTLARGDYYGDEINGTPTMLFNGKLLPRTGGGGGVDDAKSKYEDYLKAIAPLLEAKAPIKVAVKAVQKGDKIDITAEASGIEKPNDKLRLRIALVQEKVRYTGRNNLRFHHQVVRDMPGGADGFAIKGKSIKEELTVDLAHVKETLSKYLEDFTKKGAFPGKMPAIDLKDLKVVVFVQNDENREVLGAVQAPIEKSKSE